MFEKKLPCLEVKLYCSLISWKSDHGEPLLFNGEDYLEKMQNPDTQRRIEKAKEQEKKVPFFYLLVADSLRTTGS